MKVKCKWGGRIDSKGIFKFKKKLNLKQLTSNSPTVTLDLETKTSRRCLKHL